MEKRRIKKEVQNVLDTNAEITKEVIIKAESAQFNDNVKEIFEIDNFGFIKNKKDDKKKESSNISAEFISSSKLELYSIEYFLLKYCLMKHFIYQKHYP